MNKKKKKKVKSESEVAQSCRTLSDPMDYSLPGSSRLLHQGPVSWKTVFPKTAGVGGMVMQAVGAAINAGETLLSCGSHPAMQPGP